MLDPVREPKENGSPLGGAQPAGQPLRLCCDGALKGMILAAGVGSRLSPITGVLPKPMLPVADRPVMEHTLALFARAGIRDIKVNLHHLPHLVEQYFGDGRRWGVHITYSLESTLLGTAGAVKRVERFFDRTFVVAVGDSVWDLDLRQVVASHRARGAAVTVVVKPMSPHLLHRYGVVCIAEDGRIIDFQEKPPAGQARGHLASTGLYVLEPEVLRLVPAGQHCDFARDLFPALLKHQLPFYAYCYEGPWSDIGAFDEYYRVHEEILHGAYRTLLLPTLRVVDGVYRGHHLRIHREAQIRPPVLLGHHCRIGRGAVVGPGAVVGSHSIIGADTQVERSVVGSHTYIGSGLHLDGCLAHGSWLVKLSTGTSAYVADETLLADVRQAVRWGRARRLIDVLLAGVALAGTAPLILGLGAVARACGEPVLERRRVLAPEAEAEGPVGGTRLRPFQLLQFSRQGRVGMLAERLGVAKLPALYNVMRGDMSLVGIRPLTEDEAAQVSEDWLRHLGRAPAGLTGLWWLQGGDQAPWDETLAADAYYAASGSLWGDLRILWHTALRLSRRPTA